MSGAIEGTGIGPPEPPDRAQPSAGPSGPESVAPAQDVSGPSGPSPIGAEAQRVLARAAAAGADDRQACEALVGHLIEGWVSASRREEVVRHVSDAIVDDPVFAQLLSRFRNAPEPPAPDA